MQIGFIGIGKMGSRMAQKLSDDGFEVHVWNRSQEDVLELQKTAKITPHVSIEELIKNVNGPRIIWMMVSHQAVDEVLEEVKKYISKGDVVVDGGNSFYKDTQKRFENLEKEGIHFMGVGTSGGILAIKNGFPFMVGGSKEGYDLITPVLDSLSKPSGGHQYFGEGGAGHFVKMVHNGIEYGMMQSIGEGFDVMKNSSYNLDLPKVSKLFGKGTIISGFLIDRLSEMFESEKDLESFEGIVSRSGEGDWTISAGKEEGLVLPAIETSVNYRKDSETNDNIQKSFTAKVLNALRKSFGGHEVKKS